MPKTFRETYCERFGVDLAGFEAHALRRCLYPHARPIGFLRRCLGRPPFVPDIDWISAVGHCTDRHEVRHELNAALAYDPIGSFWRRLLRIRVSGKRVLQLAGELLD